METRIRLDSQYRESFYKKIEEFREGNLLKGVRFDKFQKYTLYVSEATVFLLPSNIDTNIIILGNKEETKSAISVLEEMTRVVLN
jgi:hypothetical protein